MAESPHSSTLALDTDTPPDQLGNRAFDMRNVKPVSKVSMAARDGEVLEANLTNATLGRHLIITDAPHRTDGRLLLAAINVTDGTPKVTTVDALHEFEGALQASPGAQATLTDPGAITFPAIGNEGLFDLIGGFVV